MKEDQFEKIIRDNRDQLDHHELPEGLWKKISEESFGKTKNHPSIGLKYWKIAASILLICTIGLAVRLLTLDASPQSLGDLSPELRLIEANYQRQINDLYAELPMDQAQAAQFQWIFNELATLDSIQQDYLKDLNDLKNQDKIIGVLIDQYEKKIKLLKKLELEIKRQQHENEFPIS